MATDREIAADVVYKTLPIESLEQVGGDHYRQHEGLQPWDIIDAYGLDFYEGNILKYLLRVKGDRLEDLRKCAHYIAKKIELVEAAQFGDVPRDPWLPNEGPENVR